MVVIVILSFPPWRLGGYSLGFSFVLRPPTPTAAQVARQLYWSSPTTPEINVGFLVETLLAVSLLTAGCVAIAGTREGDVGAPWPVKLAARRVELACAAALLCPFPVPGFLIPAGLALAFVIPSFGYVGAGHSGVGAGGPLVVLLVLLVVLMYAAVFYLLLTAYLRRLLGAALPWWPPKA